MKLTKLSINRNVIIGIITALSLGLSACGATSNLETSHGEDQQIAYVDAIPDEKDSEIETNNGVTMENNYSSMEPATIGTTEKWGIVAYGTYKNAPIEWYVLENTGSEVTLLSKEILLHKAYEEEKDKDVTWEDCSLRAWLNNEFYFEAFNPKEQTSIITTTLENNNHPYWETDGGNSTDDKVFLLSLDDLATYMDISMEQYVAYCANYALGVQGYDIKVGQAWIQHCLDKAPMMKVLTNGDEDSKNCWWLRTPGNSKHQNIYVDFTGEPIYGNGNRNGSTYGIRPVIRIKY